jgi:hypothetical protein
MSKVRESESLNERIKGDILARKMDHGQLSKRKNPPTDALENLAGKKERQVGKAREVWVKLT